MTTTAKNRESKKLPSPPEGFNLGSRFTDCADCHAGTCWHTSVAAMAVRRWFGSIKLATARADAESDRWWQHVYDQRERHAKLRDAVYRIRMDLAPKGKTLPDREPPPGHAKFPAPWSEGLATSAIWYDDEDAQGSWPAVVREWENREDER